MKWNEFKLRDWLWVPGVMVTLGLLALCASLCPQIFTAARSSEDTSFGVFLLFIFVGIPSALALPSALKQKSWKRFFTAMFVSFFGILLPLGFFFLSAGLTLVHDSKEACHNGWVDCFHLGKLALAPLVLWASAALYAVEVYEVTNRTRRWIILGFFMGAIVSTVCAIFGIVMVGLDGWVLFVCWSLLVPIYTAVWYGIRAVQLIRAAKLTASPLVMTATGSLPFWAASIWCSCQTYFSLPDHPEGCFIVTAASRGHRKFVGPFLAVPHRGEVRLVNRQLATFWQFESFWRARAPRRHAAFRRVYNRIGPVIARKVTHPWLADAVYLALKPAEFFARGLLVGRRASCPPNGLVARSTQTAALGTAWQILSPVLRRNSIITIEKERG